MKSKKMKSWDINKKKSVNTPEYVKSFLSDLEELYKKHNLAVSHEDDYGSFIITTYHEKITNWLNDASLDL